MNITLTEQNVDAEILHFLPLLGQEEKSSLLAVINSFLSLKRREEGEDEFDVEAYNRDIDEAEAESEREGFVSQDEVKAQFELWRTRRIA